MTSTVRKQILLGAYLSIVSLLSAYLSETYDLSHAISLSFLSKGPSSRSSRWQKLDNFTLGVASEGQISGYVTFSLLTAFGPSDDATPESTINSIIRDVALQAAYTTVIPDIVGKRRPDIQSFEESAAEAARARLPHANLDAIRIQTFNYVRKQYLLERTVRN